MEILTDALFTQTLSLNQQATELMKAGHYEAALGLLHSAESYSSTGSQRDQQLLRVVFNNLGCCYMRGKQWPLAVKYLTKALETDKGTDVEQVVGMRINLSSVYHQLKWHEQAIEEALKGLSLLESKQRSLREDRLYVKCENCAGMAYEALGLKRKAQLHYFKGFCSAAEKLGPDQELTVSLKSRYTALSQNKDVSSESEVTLGRPGSLTAIRPVQKPTPLFTKILMLGKQRTAGRGDALPPDSIFKLSALKSPSLLKTSSSTPKMHARQRVSPSQISPQLASMVRSMKDLPVPKHPRVSVLSPDSKKLRTRRTRAPSEPHTNSSSKSNSDMDSRIHSIDEKLMTLTQQLTEFCWKNDEVRRIAEKTEETSKSGLITPGENSERQTGSAVVIQRHIRGFLARRRYTKLRQLSSDVKAVSFTVQQVSVRRPKKLILSSTKRSGRLLRFSMYNAK